MIPRLRTLLGIDSVTCVVGGAALTAFAGRLADVLGIDSTVPVRSVGGFLIAYGVVLAMLARATPRTVELAGRVTALADASWVLATAVLVAADVLSAAGDVIVALAAIPVAALGIGKVAALRSSSDRVSYAPVETSFTAGDGLPRS
jgi:hypothetical protein